MLNFLLARKMMQSSTCSCAGEDRKMSYSQTWGQVHEYLYLSTLKYKFESTCTLLKYFLNYPSVLVLILKYFCQVLEYLKYF